MNRRLLLAGGALAILGSAACEEKRAVLSEPVGAASYGFQMANLATNLPRGSVRYVFKTATGPNAARPDSMILTIAGLDTLGPNGHYTAWAGDSLGTTFTRISGLLRAQRTDSALDALGNIVAAPQPQVTVGTFSSIQNGSPRTVYTWAFELPPGSPLQTFLISIEDNAAATTPNPTRRPLWTRRGEGSPSAANGTANSPLRFGNYAGLPADQYLYSNTPARGRGFFWGNILQVTDSTLARPPLGYYYAVYAVKFVAPGQTNGDTLFVGELTSPPPRRNLSLYNSDSVRTDPLVVLDLPPSILVGGARVSADTIAKLPKSACANTANTGSCPFIGYTDVWLTLESKNGFRGDGGLSPNRILRGVVPFVITSGQK